MAAPLPIADRLQGKRRFYMIGVIVMSIAGACSALASITLQYTEKGDNQYGCRSERLMMGGKMNSNMYCTRETAACNFLSKYLRGHDRSNATVACNEAVGWHLAYCPTALLMPSHPGRSKMAADYFDHQCTNRPGPLRRPSSFTTHHARYQNGQGGRSGTDLTEFQTSHITLFTHYHELIRRPSFLHLSTASTMALGALCDLDM